METLETLGISESWKPSGAATSMEALEDMETSEALEISETVTGFTDAASGDSESFEVSKVSSIYPPSFFTRSYLPFANSNSPACRTFHNHVVVSFLSRPRVSAICAMLIGPCSRNSANSFTRSSVSMTSSAPPSTVHPPVTVFHSRARACSSMSRPVMFRTACVARRAR